MLIDIQGQQRDEIGYYYCYLLSLDHSVFLCSRCACGTVLTLGIYKHINRMHQIACCFAVMQSCVVHVYIQEWN